MRIVSLACSNTEIVCRLGQADCLVGVDDHSDRPAEILQRLPRVGPDLQIDIEAVAALKPDLVLASLTVPGHEKVVAGLERAGLPFLAPEPNSLEDVFDSIVLIGEAIGAGRAANDLNADLRALLVERSVPDQGRPGILVQWWPKPVISPGRTSWVHDLIVLAGGSNPLGEEPVKSRPLSDEEVTELDPEAIILSWCGVPTERYRPEVVLDNPAWQGVRAVSQGRVIPIPEADLGRPSPGLVAGYRGLCKAIDEIHQSIPPTPTS